MIVVVQTSWSAGVIRQDNGSIINNFMGVGFGGGCWRPTTLSCLFVVHTDLQTIHRQRPLRTCVSLTTFLWFPVMLLCTYNIQKIRPCLTQDAIQVQAMVMSCLHCCNAISNKMPTEDPEPRRGSTCTWIMSLDALT